MSVPVELFVYDLSQGMASSMSLPLLGKQIDGVWHTSIHIYGKEFFFGGGGVEYCVPHGTILGAPNEVVKLGFTDITEEIFMDYLHDLSSSTFRASCYSLLQHNCNNFSDEIAQFLTGKKIPSKITNLPSEVLSTPFGMMIKPFIESMSVSPSEHSVHITPAADVKNEALPAQDPKCENPCTPIKETDVKERFIFEAKTYKESCFPKTFNENKEMIAKLVDTHSLDLIEEIVDYIVNVPSTWSLSSQHLSLLVKLLSAENSEHCNLKLFICNLLQSLILIEEFVNMASYESAQNLVVLIKSFIKTNDNDTLKAFLKFMCNCCSSEFGCKFIKSKVFTDLVIFCADKIINRDDVNIRILAVYLADSLTHDKIEPAYLCLELSSALIDYLSDDNTLSTDPTLSLKTLQVLYRCLIDNREVASLFQMMEINLVKYELLSENHKKILKCIQAQLQS